MDNSRDEDLKALHTRFHDKSKSLRVRNLAYRTFQSIQAQVKDRTLVELRHRLIKAHRANDVIEVEKIESQIDEHTRRTGKFASRIA